MRTTKRSSVFSKSLCGLVLCGVAAGAAYGSLITGDTPGSDGDVYGDYVVDLAGLVVFGDEGDPLNPLMDLTGNQDEVWITEHVRLAGVMWDVNYETFEGAWLSDLRIGITVNAGGVDEEQILIAPAFGDDFLGHGVYESDGWIDLIALGMDVFVGDDHTIRVELFSSYFIPVGDTVFGQGSTLTLGLQVPGPGGGSALVLAGVLATRRKR